MAFDWVRFLDRNGLHYVTSGRNVRRGNVSMPCPFCGDDPSENLGVSLDGKGWSCWRNPSHKGRAPHALIMALLNCSRFDAARIVASEDVSYFTSDESFKEDGLRRLGLITDDQVYTEVITGRLKLLDDFRDITERSRVGKLVMPYMQRRGYSTGNVLDVAYRYGLKFAMNGPFAYRIIFPVMWNKQVVTWTGRTVADSEELKYKSLSDNPQRAARQGLPAATRNIKDCLFDYDTIKRGGETLVVCEGPFDALRMGFFGERYGIHATCLFGKMPSPAQIDLLYELTERYDEVLECLDSDARADGFLRIPEYLKTKHLPLPSGVKDPGELDHGQFKELFKIR